MTFKLVVKRLILVYESGAVLVHFIFVDGLASEFEVGNF